MFTDKAATPVPHRILADGTHIGAFPSASAIPAPWFRVFKFPPKPPFRPSRTPSPVASSMRYPWLRMDTAPQLPPLPKEPLSLRHTPPPTKLKNTAPQLSPEPLSDEAKLSIAAAIHAQIIPLPRPFGPITKEEATRAGTGAPLYKIAPQVRELPPEPYAFFWTTEGPMYLRLKRYCDAPSANPDPYPPVPTVCQYLP